ncbi:MAG: DUF5615 family PIN-like protein, partial [Taibaiella sp.]|nr:DUF5615 family PIN-like protein [Taibaiella sp.]
MPLDWEIWVDEHISPIVAKWMKEYTGWDVKSFYYMNFKGLPDKDIYLSAKGHGKVILVSKDTDFPELISRLGSPPKLINIR